MNDQMFTESVDKANLLANIFGMNTKLLDSNHPFPNVDSKPLNMSEPDRVRKVQPVHKKGVVTKSIESLKNFNLVRYLENYELLSGGRYDFLSIRFIGGYMVFPTETWNNKFILMVKVAL